MTQPEQARPVDVDTGFWLWVAALPLMVAGYVVDVLTSSLHVPMVVYAVAAMVMVVVSAIVVTLLILMRHGYRWTRTLLTGGGFATAVYAVTSLFTVQRATAAAVVYALTTIVGSVLIAGGVYLLHRKDAHGYFTR